jgi:P27 family predicted phage terminase small subunit
MGRRLADMGVLTQIDRAALAAYCSAWARWCEAEGEIRKHGLLIKTPNNYPAQNPYLAIANRAQEIMLKVAVEFGMTPSSRTRIKVNGGSEEENQGGIRGFIDGRPKD